MSTRGLASAGISGVEVSVDGTPLDPSLKAVIGEVRVEQSIAVPATFALRLDDPRLEVVDEGPFSVGAQVKISMAGPGDAALVEVLDGLITALEPEFRADGVTVAVRGYDRSHAMTRSRRTDTYQDSTVADVVRRVAERNGLSGGDLQEVGGVQEFIQQSDETDLDFLRRLARRAGCELTVDAGEVHMRRIGDDGGESPIELRYGKELRAFRPRVSGVQQVETVTVRGWDYSSKQAIEAVATPATPGTIGIERDTVVGALAGGELLLADAAVTSQEEAQALADGIAAEIAGAFAEADGACAGDARIRAGRMVDVQGLGATYSGTYRVSSVDHVMRGTTGFQTRFRVSGAASRGLLDLASPPERRRWDGSAVAVGVVTQNEDPDGLGRVRISFPTLGDDAEGWWARIASPGAGKERGLIMTPLVGDEVLVAFEHDDVRRPYVIGALWNGEDSPGDLPQTDGSFRLHSDERIEMTANGEMTISGEKSLEITTTEKAVLKPSGNHEVESGGEVKITAASAVTLEAGSSLTIKGGSISIQASGQVSVSGSAITLG